MVTETINLNLKYFNFIDLNFIVIIKFFIRIYNYNVHIYIYVNGNVIKKDNAW